MEFMEVIGWIVLCLFALVGLAVGVLAIGEYILVQGRMLGSKVEKEVEVRKEHIAAKAESKKVRLAKKRAVDDVIADKKLEIRLAKTKLKANEAFGESVFEGIPVISKTEEPVEVEISKTEINE